MDSEGPLTAADSSFLSEGDMADSVGSLVFFKLLNAFSLSSSLAGTSRDDGGAVADATPS